MDKFPRKRSAFKVWIEGRNKELQNFIANRKINYPELGEQLDCIWHDIDDGILPGKEGMVHISQLSEARVERVEDVVRQGDEVTVRVREIDSRGRINLTLRGVSQNGGMSYPQPTPTPVAPLS